MTWGSQNCRGGIPDFIAIARGINSLLILIELIELSFEKINKDSTIIIDAPAWTMKYLIAELVELKLILFNKRGINIIKLISIAIHIRTQDSEEITTKGVKNKIK